MKKILNLNTLAGILLLIAALWPLPQPVVDELALLDIDKPTSAIIETVAPVAALVTDPTDRAKLAVFNQAFAQRVGKYTTDTQQLNNVYVLAAQNFFSDSMKDKYRDFDKELLGVFTKSIGDDNHQLTEDEKRIVGDYFMGLAWSFVQKR
jgi:hypothetical protein